MLEAHHARKAPRATMSIIGGCTTKGEHPTSKYEHAWNIREANELLCKCEDEARAM